MDARDYFERARLVLGICGYEYAIELYLQGLAVDSDNVDAHQELREVALKRKAAGGRALGMFERMKLSGRSAGDKAKMLAAEKLLAYEPGDVAHMLDMARHAQSGGYTTTAEWIEGIVRRAIVTP